MPRPLGMSLSTVACLVGLGFLDVKYNHGAALHGLGGLAQSILPNVQVQTGTNQR